MDSVSSRQFREFRNFSAIAENHWPYHESNITLDHMQSLPSLVFYVIFV